MALFCLKISFKVRKRHISLSSHPTMKFDKGTFRRGRCPHRPKIRRKQKWTTDGRSCEKTEVLIWKLTFFNFPSCFSLTPPSLRDISPNGQGRLKRKVNFMVKLKASRIYPSLPLLQGEVSSLTTEGIKNVLKKISKFGKFQRCDVVIKPYDDVQEPNNP